MDLHAVGSALESFIENLKYFKEHLESMLSEIAIRN